MAELSTQSTPQPTRKAISGALGGGVATAIVTIGDWIAGLHGLAIPVPVDGAFIVLVTFAVSWFTREWA